MSDYNRQRRERDERAYTGETIVMPGRQEAGSPARAPQLPRRSQRRIWPTIRLALLAALGLVLVALLLIYLQARAVAAQVVVRDARLNPPLATPLGGFNLLLVGVDARPDHPEEGVRGDTLIVVHLDSLGRWASTLGVPTQNMRLVSPYQPSFSTATSMFTMSPFFSICWGEGMPWHTTWFTEVSTVLG